MQSKDITMQNHYAVFTKNASYTNNAGNKTEKATGDSIIL